MGVYACKVTSDIGVAVTKAKLHVQELYHEEKEKLKIKQAAEKKEKLLLEKAKLDKKRAERKIRKSSITTEQVTLKETATVSEVTVTEQTKEISKLPDKRQAEQILPILEPVVTEAIASCKKIDEKVQESIEEKAEHIISPVQPVTVSETTVENKVEELKETKVTKASATITQETLQKAEVTVTNVKEVIEKVKQVKKKQKRMEKEVEEVLEFVKAKELGPGELPVRELAEIGFLVRHGITVKEVTVLYDADKFPALRKPESQSALVNLVERQGYGTLISEVLTEETTLDENVAATVGFRAFMRMVDLKHATVEEVITNFAPEDFQTHPWEYKEAKEVMSQLVEDLQTVKKTEVKTFISGKLYYNRKCLLKHIRFSQYKKCLVFWKSYTEYQYNYTHTLLVNVS